MQSETHAFIVRIWHEALDSDENSMTWRGSIEHVSKGQRLYFTNPDAVVYFIQEQAELRIKTASPWWRTGITRFKAWIRQKIDKV